MSDNQLDTYRKLLAQQQRSWGINPDEAAKQRSVANQLNVPVQAVRDAPENAILKASFDKVWNETQGLGTLQGKLTNSDFHDVAKDDVETLAKIEKYGSAKSAPEDGFFSDIYRSIRRGFAGAKFGIGQLVNDIDLFGLNKQRKAAAEANGISYDNNVDQGVNYAQYQREVRRYSPDSTLQRQQQELAAINKNGSLLSAAKFALNNPALVANVSAESFGRNAPSLALTTAAGVTTGGAGVAATAGATSFGTEYYSSIEDVLTEHAEELGGLSDSQRWAYALSRKDWVDEAKKKAFKRGLAVGTFDALTAGVAGKLLGGAKPTVVSAASRAAGELAIQAGGGAAGEGAAQAVTGEFKPADIVMEAVAEIPTGIHEGIGNYREARLRAKPELDNIRAAKAAEDEKQLNEQSAITRESKLAKRAPDVAADFVNDVYGENKKIYIDGDALMQSGVADRIVAKIPEMAAKIQEAADTGGMVELTRGDYHVALNEPDIQAALAPIVRSTPDAMTATEAQEWANGGQDEALKSAFDEAVNNQNETIQSRAPYEAVKQNIEQQLVATGRYTPEQASANAALAASLYQAQGSRLGITAQELFAQKPLNIVGESLTQAGTFEQALASAPPRGWLHSTDPQDAVDLWNGKSGAKAVFWTGPNVKLSQQFPELSGYSHSLAQDDIQHIKRQHGNAEQEALRGQIAISERDIARIPEIVADYGAIHSGLLSPQGSKRLMFAKSFDDGTIVYLGQISRKKKDIKTVSMWKYPSAIDEQRAIEIAVTSNQTFETEAGISHKEAVSNNDTPADSENQLFQSDSIESSPRGAFNPSTDTIAVLQQADASTFAHELGHFFLEMQADLAAKLNGKADTTQSEQQVLKDMDTLLKWFGVKDLDTWQAMTLEEQREHHEKFARGFEAYLYEGKAPSRELRDVFRRFAAWLKHVYQSFARLNVTLTDDVRAVYGRMLATDEQIQEAEYENGMLPLFASAEEMGVDEETFAKYQDMQQNATAEAQEFLQGKALRDLAYIRNVKNRKIRELRKQYKADFDKAKAEANDSVMHQPVYRAYQMLTDKSDAGIKLDLETLQKSGLPSDVITTLKKRRMVAKEGGVPADFVADLIFDENGNPEFDSGESLVRALAEVQTPKEAIEQAAYDKLLAEKGEVPTDSAFENEADLAVHSDVRARILATEFKALSNAVGSEKLIRRAASTYARDRVAGFVLRDLRPSKFTRAEAKASKLAFNAIKKGDVETAAYQKRNQLVQNALAKEVLDARDEAEKARRELSHIANRTLRKTAKSYDADLMSAAQAIIGMFGIASKKAEHASVYLENVAKYDKQTYALAEGVLRRSEQLAARVDGRFDNLTVEQMRALRDDIDALRHIAKRLHKVEIDGKLIDVQEAQDELRAHIDRLPKKWADKGVNHNLDRKERALQKFYETTAALKRVESWAEALDGKIGNTFTKYVFLPIKEASDRYRTEKGRYLTKYRDVLKDIDFGGGLIEAKELNFVFGKDSGGSGMNEVMHAILHTGNESNKRKMLLGRKWASEREDGSIDTSAWDAFIARMIDEGKLTKQHFDAAQSVWDLMEEMKPKAQEAHREAYGYYFDEITADPFLTPFGEYRGGYVPAITDSRLSVDAQTRELGNIETESMEFSFPTTSKGFTKSRVEYNSPLLLNLNSLSGHIDKVLRFSNLEIPIRDVQRILSGIKGEVEQVAPGSIQGLIQPWLSRVASQQLTSPGKADGGFGRVLSILRNRAGMAAMIGNIPNAIQQAAGVFPAAVKVKPKYMASAMVEYIKDHKGMAKAVTEASEYMDARMSNQIGLMTENIEQILINPNLWQKANNFAAEKAYFAQSFVDSVMSYAIWQGAYNQAIAEGKNHQDAVRFGDNVIRTTQGSTLVEDISRVETGHPFIRLFTQFYGYFNMVGNLLASQTAIASRDETGATKAKRLAYLWGVGFYANAVAAELIIGALRGGYDDEDKDGEVLDDWLKQAFLLSPAKTGVATIPLAGNLINLFDDKPYNDRALSAPALSMIETGVKFARGKSNLDKQSGVRDAATALAIFGGIPAAPLVAKPVGYLYGVSKGEIRPTSTADAVRGTVTGVASKDSKR